MAKRWETIDAALEAKLRTRQRFNLKDLVRELDIPVDVHKVITQAKVNKLRDAVYRVADRLGMRVNCDGDCNVTVITTLDDVRGAIDSVKTQIAGRGQQYLFLLELEKELRANSRRKAPAKHQALSGQITLDDLAGGETLPSAIQGARRQAPVVALRAKDAEATRRQFLAVLLEDPQRMADFGQAASEFYRKVYGFDIPPTLFSEGVISPAELHQVWRSLISGLRRISREPDLMRTEATNSRVNPVLGPIR